MLVVSWGERAEPRSRQATNKSPASGFKLGGARGGLTAAARLVKMPARRSGLTPLRERSEGIRPLSSTVKDSQDFHSLIANAVSHDEARGSDHEFPSVRNPSWASEVRMCRQALGPGDDQLHYPLCAAWVLAGDVISDEIEIASRRPCPDDSHPEIEYLCTI
jgi:hypothetical protein